MSARGAHAGTGTARAHLNAGRLDQAEAALRAVLAETPEEATALYLMGRIALLRGRPDAALEMIREALDLAPDHAEAHFHLGTVLGGLGRAEESLASLREAARLAPDNASVWRNLGICLAKLERYDAALDGLERASTLDPNNPDRWFDIALLDLERNHFEAAEKRLRRVLEAAPAHRQATIALGQLLVKQERYKEALPYILEALEREPDNLGLLVGAGRAHREGGDRAASAKAYERALALDRGSVPALIGMAITRTAEGRLDEARACYREALTRDPDNGAALGNSAQIRRFGPEDRPLIERMIRVAGRGEMLDSTRILLEFSIGKALDDLGDSDAAFAYFARANGLAKRSQPFDPEAFSAFIDDTIATFDRGYFLERSDWGAAVELPIFVVGMGRSGTSLVEQILASHGQVHGAGEVEYIEGLCLSLSNQAPPRPDGGRPSLPRLAPTLGPADALGCGRAYLDKLRAHAPDAARIVDKLPLNFLYLGIIATILPGARIIHCRRDPLDTCLSLFFHYFSDSQPYAYSLEHLGFYYREYRRLMAHWRAVLPKAMLELDYEALVDDLERESRRLIEFCGLPWDARCLAFHETERAVRTASLWQVQQPIYRRSVGRWHRYQAHLQPLKDALGPLEMTEGTHPCGGDRSGPGPTGTGF